MRFENPGHSALPLFPLNTVLFPGMMLPLHIFERRYRLLLRDRAGHDPAFGIMLIQRGAEVADASEPHLVGTAASVTRVRRYPDGRADVVVRGGRRFHVVATDWSPGHLAASVSWLDEPAGDAARAAAGMHGVALKFESFLAVMRRATGAALPMPPLPRDPAALSYAIAAQLPLDNRERQQLLECDTAADRLAALARILHREQRFLVETGAGAGIPHPVPERFSPN